MVRTWSRLPDHSSSTLLLFFSLCSLLLRSIFSFHNGHISALPNNLFCHITIDLHRHFGATSAILFMETEPRYASFHSGYEPRHWSTHRKAPRSDAQLSSSSSTRISRKNHHIFKCRGISSKLKIILDSATYRRSSISSGLWEKIVSRYYIPGTWYHHFFSKVFSTNQSRLIDNECWHVLLRTNCCNSATLFSVDVHLRTFCFC